MYIGGWQIAIKAKSNKYVWKDKLNGIYDSFFFLLKDRDFYVSLLLRFQEELTGTKSGVFAIKHPSAAILN